MGVFGVLDHDGPSLRVEHAKGHAQCFAVGPGAQVETRRVRHRQVRLITRRVGRGGRVGDKCRCGGLLGHEVVASVSKGHAVELVRVGNADGPSDLSQLVDSVNALV